MNTDTEVRIRGLRALVEALGTVEAERFITLILREPFDYTQWQRQLWTDRSVDELSKAAMGTAVAAVLHTSFSLGDAEVFQQLLEQAGFRDVVLSRSVKTLRFASPEAFVRVWVQGSVLGRAGVQVHDDVLTAMVREVTAALRPYSNAEGLGVPIVAHLAVGHTAGECSAQRASS